MDHHHHLPLKIGCRLPPKAGFVALSVVQPWDFQPGSSYECICTWNCNVRCECDVMLSSSDHPTFCHAPSKSRETAVSPVHMKVIALGKKLRPLDLKPPPQPSRGVTYLPTGNHWLVNVLSIVRHERRVDQIFTCTLKGRYTLFHVKMSTVWWLQR